MNPTLTSSPGLARTPSSQLGPPMAKIIFFCQTGVPSEPISQKITKLGRLFAFLVLQTSPMVQLFLPIGCLPIRTIKSLPNL